MPENRVLDGHTKPEKKNPPLQIFFSPKHLFSLPLQRPPFQAPGTRARTQLKKTYKGSCFIIPKAPGARCEHLHLCGIGKGLGRSSPAT